MKLTMMKPAPDLRRLISHYFLIEDLDANFEDELILSAPRPVGCLCIQLADMVETDFRDQRPVMSVGGVQARVRQFWPRGVSRTLLIYPTALGSIRFMPHEGETLFDQGYDIAGLIGDGAVWTLRAAASAAPDANTIALEADKWLRQRFEKTPERHDMVRLAAAMDHVGQGGRSIAAAADASDLSERQLERCFRNHVGVSPKRYQQIFRVTRSLQSVLSGRGDPLEGYADQAHQIRNWQAFLGFSPGDLRRKGPTQMASVFQSIVPTIPAGWAHFV